MIWIATLCLLAIAAWLIFNGINERRWVQAHSHDETVAADPGFLPSFSTAVSKRRVDGEGKVSIGEENTRFARAVAKVQEKTATVGEKIEARVTAAREGDDSDFFGRSVNKVRTATDKIGTKLDDRMRHARMKGEESAGKPIAEEDGLFPSAVSWVSEKTGALGERIAERAKSVSDAGGERLSLDKEDSFFARAVKKVGGSLEKVESKLDAQAEKAQTDDDDMMMRMSRKVGERVNEIDERIVEKSRKVNDIEERIINSGSEMQRRASREQGPKGEGQGEG